MGTEEKVYNYHSFGRYPLSCLLLKHDVSETGFCFRLQVNLTQMSQ
jgi:hypothetical protein